jgi:hypothetical protein
MPLCPFLNNASGPDGLIIETMFAWAENLRKMGPVLGIKRNRVPNSRIDVSEVRVSERFRGHEVESVKFLSLHYIPGIPDPFVFPRKHLSTPYRDLNILVFFNVIYSINLCKVILSTRVDEQETCS